VLAGSRFLKTENRLTFENKKAPDGPTLFVEGDLR
jgi:hypothetical protein